GSRGRGLQGRTRQGDHERRRSSRLRPRLASAFSRGRRRPKSRHGPRAAVVLEVRVATMLRRAWMLASSLIVAAALAGPATAADAPAVLRVCGDPDNLPFSNSK